MATKDIMQARTLILGLITLIAFTATNVDPTLGTIYAIFIFAYFVGLLSDKLVSFPFQRPGKNFFTEFFLFGLIGFGAFYIGIIALLGILQLAVGALTPASVTSLFANIEPFFATSKIATLLVFGFLVALVETNFFFGIAFEFLLDLFRIPKTHKEPKAHLIGITVASAFAIFHMTALGLPSIGGGSLSNPGIIAALLFGYVSSVMVLYYKATIQASGTHVINNSLSVMDKFGWIPKIFGA